MIWSNLFWRFGDLKNESHFLKKSHLYLVFLSRIAEIAEHSVRFLDLVMLPSSGSSDGLKNDRDNRPMPSYDTELTALHDLIR